MSGAPKIETTFSSNAKFKGIDTVNMVTYWTVPRPGGMLYGEAKGVVMSKDVSGEVVTFTAYAGGRFTSLGRARFHGSVYYRTTSTGKLAFLNNLVGLFEHDSDEQGNASSKVWEWKYEGSRQH